MRVTIRSFWPSLVICLLALVVRAAFWYRDGSALNQDLDAYLEIARHLAQGAGFARGEPPVATAYRPPLYPLLIAGLFAIGGHLWCIGGIHVALGTLTTALTLRCGQLLNLGSGRFLAAGFVAADPLLIRYTTLPMTETLCAALIALWCWLVLEFPWNGNSIQTTDTLHVATQPIVESGRFQTFWQYQLRNRPALETWNSRSSVELGDHTSFPGHELRGLFHGICFALICLCRPAFLGATALVVAGIAAIGIRQWIARRNKKTSQDANLVASLRSILWPGLASLAGMVIVLMPWIVRNAIVIGKPTPATTHGGYTLLLANNPVFYHEVLDGTAGAIWEERSLLEWQRSLEIEMRNEGIPIFDEVARDNWMYRRARSNIIKDPLRFLRAIAYRSGCFWSLAPSAKTSHLGRVASWAIAIFYGLVSIGGLFGLARFSGAEWRQWSPLLLLPLTLWLTHLVYWTDTRMRAPVVPVLALLAARGLARPFVPRPE